MISEQITTFESLTPEGKVSAISQMIDLNHIAKGQYFDPQISISKLKEEIEMNTYNPTEIFDHWIFRDDLNDPCLIPKEYRS